MKKSNTTSKLAKQKQGKEAKKKAENSVLYPSSEDFQNRLHKETEIDYENKTLIKASKMNNLNNLIFDKDISDEDIDIPTDISGYGDDAFDNENDYYETEVDNFDA